MNDLTTFTSAALLALLVYTVQNFVRYARAADLNGVLGIGLAWGGGIVAAFIAAQANITDQLVLIKGGPVLGLLDGWSLILLGLGLGSVASFGKDWLAARDNNDTQRKPTLVTKTNPVD